MHNNLLFSGVLAASFLALFGLGELLYHTFKVRAELTRKLIHFGTGFITLLFPVLLDSHWYVLALCSSFALILVISKRYGYLKSINAIDRDSFGSLAYPVAVYGCYLCYSAVSNYVFFYVPVLILAIADPVAAITGKRWPLGKYSIGNETKTIVGSTAFFIVATMTAFICLQLNIKCSTGIALLISLIAGLTTSFTEAITRKGWDNITIPLTAMVMLFLARYAGMM